MSATTIGISEHAAAAKMIRAELKKAFPGAVFSVKSKSYSGGDSVHITWNDGPTSEKLNAIVNKYQYGDFNGMNDSYEYTNEVENLPQVKYVIVNRHMSDETREAVKQELMQRYGLSDFEDSTVMDKLHCWADQAIWREVSQRDL